MVRQLKRTCAPVAAYVLALSLGALSGYRPRIPWEDYQILDASWLRDGGVRALLCLHSQPPGYNTLVWLALTLGDALGVSATSVLASVFWACGLAGTIALWDLALATLKSRAWAGALLALQLASPAFYWYAFKLQYEFVLASVFMILFALLRRQLEAPSNARCAGVFACLAGIVFTRTLFAPLWGVLMLGALLVVAPPPGARVIGARVALFVACALVLCAWPLKNYAVYGALTNTSWGGYNLQRGLPTAGDPEFERYLETGHAAQIAERSACGGLEQNRDGHKPSGALNWHHAIFLSADRTLSAQAVAWKRTHPGEQLALSAFNYAAATRATYVHPYNNQPFNSPSPLVAVGHAVAARTLFLDLRPLLESVLPAHALDGAQVEGHPLPFTLYALALPIVLAAALWLAARRMGDRTTRTLVLLGVFCVVWNIVVPALSDGIEANRMRYATAWLALWLASWVWVARGASAGRSNITPRSSA